MHILLQRVALSVKRSTGVPERSCPQNATRGEWQEVFGNIFSCDSSSDALASGKSVRITRSRDRELKLEFHRHNMCNEFQGLY